MSGPQNIHNYLQKKQFVQSSKWTWTTNRRCIRVYAHSHVCLNHCENGYLRKTTVFLNQFPQTRHQLIKIKPLWILKQPDKHIGWYGFYYINNPTHCLWDTRKNIRFYTHNSFQTRNAFWEKSLTFRKINCVDKQLKYKPRNLFYNPSHKFHYPKRNSNDVSVYFPPLFSCIISRVTTNWHSRNRRRFLLSAFQSYQLHYTKVNKVFYFISAYTKRIQ